MNKEGFVQRVNGDSFLLGVLLKLESRGLLPSVTAMGSNSQAFECNSLATVILLWLKPEVWVREDFLVEQSNPRFFGQLLETQHKAFLHNRWTELFTE